MPDSRSVVGAGGTGYLSGRVEVEAAEKTKGTVKKASIAGCECGAPLVMTFAFTKFEFICLECGRQYGWLEPCEMPATPENEARMDALAAEFAEIAPKLLTRGEIRRDCPQCDTSHDHLSHATEEEH